MAKKSKNEKKVTLKKTSKEEHIRFAEFDARGKRINELNDELVDAELLLERVQVFLRSIARLNVLEGAEVKMSNHINAYFSKRRLNNVEVEKIEEKPYYDLKEARAEDFKIDK